MKSIPFFILAILICYQNIFPQVDCLGEQIFKEKSCIGDDLSENENELFGLINDYRTQNKLSNIPIGTTACLVANRHILDLNLNLRYLTHSWSNCQYDGNKTETYKCMTDAPKTFFPNFTDSAFENAYYTSGKKVNVVDALEGWKKSPLHNAVLLNQNIFQKQIWTEGCVAIQGKFAALWFISKLTNVKKPESKGLGVSFEQAVKGLTSILSINNVSSTLDSEKWLGTSSDKTVNLELFGKKEDISEGKMSLRIRLQKDKTLSPVNLQILQTFLGNLAPEWKTRNQWLDNSLKKIAANSSKVESIDFQNLNVELKLEQNEFISLNIKQSNKPAPIEFE